MIQLSENWRLTADEVQFILQNELAEEMLDVARKRFAMAKEARDND